MIALYFDNRLNIQALGQQSEVCCQRRRLLYPQTEMLFSIGRESVWWWVSKLHDSLGLTKLTNSLARQQFEQDERS